LRSKILELNQTLKDGGHTIQNAHQIREIVLQISERKSLRGWKNSQKSTNRRFFKVQKHDNINNCPGLFYNARTPL